MNKKMLSLLTVTVLSFSMLTACGNTPANTKEVQQSSQQEEQLENQAQKDEASDSKQVEADQLLKDLVGSYQELWPVLFSTEYKQIWIDDSAAYVGDDQAEAATEKLESMVTGEVYGLDAVEAYKDGGGAYFCGFTQNVATIKVEEGNVIKGLDSAGKELFSHSYHYVGMENVRGLYEYKSDDEDSGEFTYFLFAPDTPETTYHIEFRYGSDLEALGQYDAGEYAYWLGAGISTDYDQKMVEACIKLFCEENLSQ